jgi:hypothetical protein
LRWVLVGGFMLAMLVAPPPLRSQTLSASPNSPTSDWATHEQLKKLVPERVGKWKLFGTGPEPMRVDGFQPSGVLAEFRRGKDRVQVKVMQGDPGPVPVLSAPIEENSVAGTKKAYTEGGVLVREAYRVADGRTDVTVVRDEGVIAKAHSFRAPASELKAILLGIKANSP